MKTATNIGINNGTRNPFTNQVQVTRYATAKHEQEKVGKLERTHKIIRTEQAREQVYADNSRVLGMAKLEQQRNSNRDKRAAFKARRQA